jgi:hypothetical protein
MVAAGCTYRDSMWSDQQNQERNLGPCLRSELLNGREGKKMKCKPQLATLCYQVDLNRLIAQSAQEEKNAAVECLNNFKSSR